MGILGWIQIIGAILMLCGGVYMLTVEGPRSEDEAAKRRKRIYGTGFVLFGVGVGSSALDNYAGIVDASVFDWLAVIAYFGAFALFLYGSVGRSNAVK